MLHQVCSVGPTQGPGQPVPTHDGRVPYEAIEAATLEYFRKLKRPVERPNSAQHATGSLPQTIWMARAEVPPGTANVVLEFINAGGSVIDEHVFTDVDSSGDRPLFLSWRSFR